METTFYDEQHSPSGDVGLKRALTLDFNTGVGRKRRAGPVLSSPDMQLLKLGSPDLERFILQHGAVATPTPGGTPFPAPAQIPPTEAQQDYVRGFEVALQELQSQSGRRVYADLDPPVKDEPQTVPSAASSPPMSPIDMDSQERIKLERKRQRNRVAASKCRRRKLERISKLEDKVKLLKGENLELAALVTRLRENVCGLKERVMEHVHSGCRIDGHY